MKSSIKRIVQKATAVGLRDFQLNMRADLYDTKALAMLPDLGIGYLPWSGFAIRPSALVMILNELKINKCHVVIECGIGISTLFILSQCIDEDFRLLGIDDNPEWIELIEGFLKRMGISSSKYCFVHASISELPSPAKGRRWYDQGAIQAAQRTFLGNRKADLLLVDGPKGNLCDKARYPALPYLYRYLSDDFSVFLDDVHRDDEAAIAKTWCEEFNLDLRSYITMGGIAILRPAATSRIGSITM